MPGMHLRRHSKASIERLLLTVGSFPVCGDIRYITVVIVYRSAVYLINFCRNIWSISSISLYDLLYYYQLTYITLRDRWLGLLPTPGRTDHFSVLPSQPQPTSPVSLSSSTSNPHYYSPLPLPFLPISHSFMPPAFP